MIPIVYTILILPLEFGLEIYSDYEQVFVRMKFRDNQDKKIQRKHRWRVIRTCKLSLRKILLFRKEYVNKMYGLMSEETFDNIMREKFILENFENRRIMDYIGWCSNEKAYYMIFNKQQKQIFYQYDQKSQDVEYF